jgi:4-aminobutyrate aminotransferase/(S)-3-amino-2-methylpropionate transaminase
MAAVPRGVYHATPIFAARAEGAILEDVDGNRFIDFAGGIGCSNVGHRAAPVMAAIRAQLDRFLHTCFSVAPYEGYVRLAEKLNELAPGKFEKKTFLANSGAEAVENAVKIARAYTKRPALLCFEDAFHGRTLLTMTLTSKTHPYKADFAPFASDVYRVPYGYCRQCSAGEQHTECPASSVTLEKIFKRVVAPETIAAVIIEPVLGEGGFMAPAYTYIRSLADICRKHKILLIADEVQSGIARTGKMFACEHYGIEPDLLVTAKSLGGGLPISAVTGRAEVMDAPEVGAIGGTFIGNPLSCEAALAALEIVEREDLCGRALHIGEHFLKRAKGWQKRWPNIAAIHGLGAMRSLELIRSSEGWVPADEETRKIVKYCYERGLILLSAGTFGNVVRLLVPLVITDAQFDEGLSVMEAALHDAFGKAQPAREGAAKQVTHAS